MSSITHPGPAPGLDTQADLDALDRGVIDAGLTAAQAMATVQSLERRVATLEADLLDAYRAMARVLGIPEPQPPAREQAAKRWHMTPA